MEIEIGAELAKTIQLGFTMVALAVIGYSFFKALS